MTIIEKLLNILGQSGHFYRIVSEGYCVPKEGCKLIVEVLGILPLSFQLKIRDLGFGIDNVGPAPTMYFIQK